MLKRNKKSLDKFFLITLSFFLFACNSIEKKKSSKNISKGIWRMTMDLNGQELPFNFTLNNNNDQWEMVIINADERIKVQEIEQKNDSLFIQLPVFESEFKLAIVNPDSLSGEWINYYKSADYKVKSFASFGKSYRFTDKREDFFKLVSGKYETTFSPDSENPSKAIGLFYQDNTNITGTFVTETGDYRHLEGSFIQDTLFLSTFDGSHAFLFKAYYNDTLFQGKFWSGTHWEENWVAHINNDFTLRNPDSLTFIKDGYDGLSFEFPNEKKELVSLESPTYTNKVVIVQIMGSWCPNCLDETRYFTELYNKYNSSGLEIIALAFERTRSEEAAFKNLNRLKSKTGAPYQILLGGATRDDKASDALPMLNHIMSYPTAIFIDKKGQVRKIHTGFYGPGTGDYYNKYTEETEVFIETLLKE